MEYLIGYRNLFFLIYYYPVNGSVFQICDFFSLSYIEVFMLEKNIVELLLTLALYEMLWTRQNKTIWSLSLRNSQSSQRNKYRLHLWQKENSGKWYNQGINNVLCYYGERKGHRWLTYKQEL